MAEPAVGYKQFSRGIKVNLETVEELKELLEAVNSMPGSWTVKAPEHLIKQLEESEDG